MRRKKRLGNGASISCFAKFIHPSQPWRDKLVNKGLNIFGRQEMMVKRRKRVCVLITHDDFPGQPFHVALGNITVESEGPEDDFFDAPNPSDNEAQCSSGPEEPPAISEMQRRVIVTQENLHSGSTSELRAMGVEVDDDNDPAPENVPDSNRTAAAWNDAAIDLRKIGPYRNMSPSLKGMTSETVSLLSPKALFLLLFPTEYLKKSLLPATNEHLPQHWPLTFDEFIVFLGIIFGMAMV